MLTSTFIHVSGIGPASERRIWETGAVTWSRFVEMYPELMVPAGRKALILPVVEESITRLENRDHAYFAKALAPKEHWRALSEFGDEIAYLDIETTGCNGYDTITVIGIYDGYEMHSFVQGINLQDFPAQIARYRTLVTFFGSGFDLPFIRRTFPDLKLDQLHVDLCPLFRRIGLSGGLKHIETVLGVRRIPETVGLDGMDAVRLWYEYKRGSREALDLLLLYNKEDVVNMKDLLAHGVREMLTRLEPPIQQVSGAQE